MTTSSPPRLEALLISEDVRLEATGLLTVVGLFTGTMYLGEIPAALPQLSVLALLRGMRGLEEFTIQLEVSLGDIEKYRNKPVQCKKPPPEDTHAFGHRMRPFVIEEPGRYRFKILLDSGSGVRSFSRSLDVMVRKTRPVH